MSGSAFKLLARPIQHALWDMRWEALRPIQIDAIRLLLTTQQDVLISARTASGKTEAAFLPVLSRLYEEPVDGIGAMYIGPLKALINDQFRRLEDLCTRAEIPVHRWHGDVDAGRKSKLLQQPRGVLLITPESLESFFVNRSSVLGRVFHGLRFVVIDEIHSLLGRERGLQLRSQLFRLRRYTQHEPRLIGLSATIGDAIDRYQSWLRPTAPLNVAHVHDPGEQKQVLFGIQTYDATKDKKASAVPGEEDSDEDVPPSLIADILRAFGGRKNLIFCNSRQTVEWLADSLNDACRREGRPAEFLVHHGSVSKEVRLQTEDEMRGSRPATAVCSATLELGIDIGSVTTVGQIGACWSVNSQVQRLGRSGRRDSEAHCMRVLLPLTRQPSSADLVDRLYPELLQAIGITELMRQRWVEPPDESRFDLSTLVQQILSSLAEHGGILAKPLYTHLVNDGAFRELDQGTFIEVLRSLKKHSLVEQADGALLLLTPKGETAVHDLEFYSSFATSQELVVRYEGRTIGSLSALYVPQPDDHFLLAGRRWQVIEVNLRQAEILVRPAVGRKPPKFAGGGGEIHARIREEMRRVISHEDDFEYLDATGSEFLRDGRSAFRDAGGLESPFVAIGDRTCLWFTWTGTRVQRTLMMIADRTDVQASDRRIAIEFTGTPQSVAVAMLDAVDRVASPDELAADIPMSGWRKFDGYLSEDLLRKSYACDYLDLAAARSKIGELRSFTNSVTPVVRASRVHKSASAEPSRILDATRLCDALSDVAESTTASSLVTSQSSDLALAGCEFVAFDLETTGLQPLWAQILEIGAVRFRSDGTELGRYQELVNPGCAIPEAAFNVHGITDDAVADKPTISEALPRFFSFLGGTHTIALAHNASFDHAFLATAAALHQLKVPDISLVDTLALAQQLLPGVTSYRLETLAQYFRLPCVGAHRALADSLLLKSLFVKLLSCGSQPQTVGQLLTLCQRLLLSDTIAKNVQPPPGFELLVTAIEERQRIQILYASSGRGVSMREITPLRIVMSGGRYYLSAQCHFDESVKTFRLDRVKDIVSAQ